MEKNNILITGGAGFLGGILCHYLQERNITFVVVDNLSSGKYTNIPQGTDFVYCDYGSVEKYCDKLSQCDIIIHLGGSINVTLSEKDPVLFYKNNTLNLIPLMNEAQKYSIKGIINISSAAVYGDNKNKQHISLLEYSPVSNYGMSKLLNEEIINKYNMSYITLRVFNLYGIAYNITKTQSGFVELLQQNNQITVFNYGKSTRDYVHVLDVCQAIYKSILVLRINTQNNNNIHATFDIGSGVSITTNDVIKNINPNIKILRRRKQRFEIEHSVSNISPAINILGYTPQYFITKKQ